MAALKKVQEATAVDLGALLDDGDGAVVTLEAGDTRLVVHRAVLAARSPVFKAMFSHDTLEASTGRVSIADMEGPVLRQLVAYCYTLQAPQLPSMAPQLLAAADKYGLSALKAASEQQVVALLSKENAADAAVLAVRHSCPKLTAAAVAFIKANTHQVLATQGWEDAMRNQLEDVIQVTKLIADPLPESRSPASGEARATPSPHHQPRSGDRRTPATAATLTAAHHTPPPDDAAVYRLRSLSGAEKTRRLLQAAEEGEVDDLRTLLAAGADVGARDEKWITALHRAAREGHVEAVRVLIEGGAEVDARTRLQNTPLHTAAANGRAAVVRLLAAHSADPNARNVEGMTPLHRAALDGHAEAAAALLEAGADSEARDDSGATPRHLARLKNRQQLVEMLT